MRDDDSEDLSLDVEDRADRYREQRDTWQRKSYELQEQLDAAVSDVTSLTAECDRLRASIVQLRHDLELARSQKETATRVSLGKNRTRLVLEVERGVDTTIVVVPEKEDDVCKDRPDRPRNV